MASRYPYSPPRSKDAPMDYQWTNRSPVKPKWAAGAEDTSTPRKRSHDALNSPAPLLNGPQQPTFGSNQNVPFLFHPTPLPQTPQPHPWAPPPQFSPSKTYTELKDIDMSEVSPLRVETGKDEEEEVTKDEGKEKEGDDKEGDKSRPMAIGGLRRVYKQRTRRFYRRKPEPQGEDDGHSSSAEESDEEGTVRALTRNTSNHYTLNLPAHPAPKSDTPYILLGYLQFFFNLSLILIFLYLFVQFIITVQKDVGLRISEYSQDIITEIKICALQYKNNHCDSDTPPTTLIQQCKNWDACMNRDPSVVGRARVGAELVAEVINGFVDPISWKTLIFTLTSLGFLTVFVNTLLSLYRAKHQPNPVAMHQPVPPFPTSNSYAPHHLNGYLSSATAPNWGGYRPEQDLESPTRRRRLEGGIAAKVK